jgi:hypothetical protein
MDKMPRFRIGAPLRAAALALLLAGPVLPATAAERVPPSGLLVQLTPEQHRQMRQEMREHWRQMPPDDRQYRREGNRERWQQMPPDDRQYRHEGNRERWQQMPPDDRQRMRDEMRARRGEGGGGGPPGGRRGRP